MLLHYLFSISVVKNNMLRWNCEDIA